MNGIKFLRSIALKKQRFESLRGFLLFFWLVARVKKCYDIFNHKLPAMAQNSNSPILSQPKTFTEFWEETLAYAQKNQHLPPGCENSHGALVQYFSLEKRFTDLEVLLNAGLQLDAGCDYGRGESTLFHAVRTDREEVVQHLLRLGAQVNHKDENGYTPIFMIHDSTPPTIIDMLINAGAQLDIAAGKSGTTPLHYFCKNFKDNTITLQLLAKYPEKLALNTFDEQGSTPMAYAIQNCKPTVVETLYRAGAKLQLKKPQGLFKSSLKFDALTEAKKALKAGPKMASYTYKPEDEQRVLDFLEPIYRATKEKQFLQQHITQASLQVVQADNVSGQKSEMQKKSFKI